MTRLPDWEARLSTFIASQRDRHFKWGQHDCILFACAAAAAMTEDDRAAAYRGRYTDRRGAALALREVGKGTLLATIDAQFSAIPVGQVRRGDIVWWNGSAGVAFARFGLFVGEERFGEARREGLVTVPRAEWERAWAVG